MNEVRPTNRKIVKIEHAPFDTGMYTIYLPEGDSEYMEWEDAFNLLKKNGVKDPARWLQWCDNFYNVEVVV